MNKQTRVDVNYIFPGRHCWLHPISPITHILYCDVLYGIPPYYSLLLLVVLLVHNYPYITLLPARQYSHVRTSQYVCSHRLPSGILISFDIDDEQSTIKRSKRFLLLRSPCLLLLLPTIPQRTESGHEGNVNHEVCCENSKF